MDVWKEKNERNKENTKAGVKREGQGESLKDRRKKTQTERTKEKMVVI